MRTESKISGQTDRRNHEYAAARSVHGCGNKIYRALPFEPSALHSRVYMISQINSKNQATSAFPRTDCLRNFQFSPEGRGRAFLRGEKIARPARRRPAGARRRRDALTGQFRPAQWAISCHNNLHAALTPAANATFGGYPVTAGSGQSATSAPNPRARPVTSRMSSGERANSRRTVPDGLLSESGGGFRDRSGG